MGNLTMSRLQCAECGRAATERLGVVQVCGCGCRKMVPDTEAERAESVRRAIQIRSALAQLVQAVESLDESALPWAVLAALHEAKQALKGEA